MLEEIKRYFRFRTALDHFTLALQFYIAFTLIQFIDFSKPNWFLYSSNPDFYRAFLFVLSIFIVNLIFVYLNYKVFRVKGINLLNVGLTGGIMFLTIDPIKYPFWVFPTLAIIANSSRFFIRTETKGKPIFNPAALTILIIFLLSFVLKKLNIIDLEVKPSFWGAYFSYNLDLKYFLTTITSLFFIPIFIYFGWKFRRIYYGISFFISTLLINFLFIENKFYFDIKILSVWAFIALIMLSDPKTTPVFRKNQIILGVLGGFILNILLIFLGKNYFPEILTVLILSFINYIYSEKLKRKV